MGSPINLDAYLQTPPDAIKTSHSEIELYTKCQRAHYYAYGLRLRSKGMSSALARGIIGHAGLAAYYQAIKDGKTQHEAYGIGQKTIRQGVPDYEVEDFMKEIIEVRKLFEQYYDNYKDRDAGLEILAVEQEFNIPVGPDFFIKMIVDLILRVPNSGIEVWDHKFVYDFFDPAVEGVIPQLPKYMGALRSVGIPVNACRYNEIRYRNTKAIEEDPSLRFHRVKVDIGPDRVIRTMKEQIQAAKQIDHLRNQGLDGWSDRVLRAANSNICRNCPFLALCAADLENKPTELIKQFDFEQRKSDLNG